MDKSLYSKKSYEMQSKKTNKIVNKFDENCQKYIGKNLTKII